MNTFRESHAGSAVYALIKGDSLRYTEGTLVSVGYPRVSPVPSGQVFAQVVDVTYTLDGKTYTDAVDVTATMFSTDKPGALTLVSTAKDPVVRELHETMKQSEAAIKDVSKHKKRIEECKTLIAQLDTAYNEKQKMDGRLTRLEESMEEILKLLKK